VIEPRGGSSDPAGWLGRWRGHLAGDCNRLPFLPHTVYAAPPFMLRPQIRATRLFMDPLGFPLDNFDAAGRWRTKSEAGTLGLRRA